MKTNTIVDVFENTMKPIQINLENGEGLAVIFVDDFDSMLIETRKLIQEVEELVPEEFCFISAWEVPLSKAQEAKMTTREILQDEKSIVL